MKMYQQCCYGDGGIVAGGHSHVDDDDGGDGGDGGCSQLVCFLFQVVVERSHVSAEMFNLYLHQNYLDFFSEVEDVERASEYLSDADLLAADWTVSL